MCTIVEYVIIQEIKNNMLLRKNYGVKNSKLPFSKSPHGNVYYSTLYYWNCTTALKCYECSCSTTAFPKKKNGDRKPTQGFSGLLFSPFLILIKFNFPQTLISFWIAYYLHIQGNTKF